jgi:hypothetical protein
MGYSTIDIERGLKISRERLREWTAKGFIKPSIPSPGQGRRAEFSREDILRVCVFDELLRIGFKRDMAGQIIQKYTLEKDPHEGEHLSYLAPDFIMIMFRGDEISAMPLNSMGEDKIIIDCASGGLKLESPFMKEPIPFWTEANGELKSSAELSFDHVHIVNLSGIRARVKAAFPG